MFISLGLSTDYYQFVIQNGTQVTPGSLAGGRAFIRWTETVSGANVIAYEIDWGRSCLGRQDCGSHSVTTQIQATDPALLDRYGPIAQRIIGTLAPMRPTQASTGDRARPACRGDQWRPVFASRSRVAFDRPRWVIGASIQYLHGPPCHLQTSLRLTVERSDGTAVAVAGTPSPLTVEADLPEDAAQQATSCEPRPCATGHGITGAPGRCRRPGCGSPPTAACPRPGRSHPVRSRTPASLPAQRPLEAPSCPDVVAATLNPPVAVV